MSVDWLQNELFEVADRIAFETQFDCAFEIVEGLSPNAGTVVFVRFTIHLNGQRDWYVPQQQEFYFRDYEADDPPPYIDWRTISYKGVTIAGYLHCPIPLDDWQLLVDRVVTLFFEQQSFL